MVGDPPPAPAEARGRPADQHLFLENVDRLLKSPAGQRGRDFAVMLASLADLGYEVEWRVVNAADYGFPQKRRRVFIVGRLGRTTRPEATTAHDRRPRPRPAGQRPECLRSGSDRARARTSRSSATSSASATGRRRSGTPASCASSRTDAGPPLDAGRRVRLRRAALILGDVLEATPTCRSSSSSTTSTMRSGGSSRAPRPDADQRSTGHGVHLRRGADPVPRPDRPASRTILTGEGGATPSRFKHLIQTEDGRFRRLTPRELERLNGFPGDWTAGMSDGSRAFMMGNALVVGLVERVAEQLIATSPRRSRARLAQTERVAS